MGTGPAFSTVRDLLAWLSAAPAGTTLSPAGLIDLLEPLAHEQQQPAPILESAPEPSWRERLWTVPAETRLGVRDLAEALDRSVSWVYQRTSTKTGKPLMPHRKLDGELMFTAGEVRAWIREQEDVLVAGPMDTPPHLRLTR